MSRTGAAHRLNIVAHAQKMIILDQGRVVQQGRHEEQQKGESLKFGLPAQQAIDK